LGEAWVFAAKPPRSRKNILPGPRRDSPTENTLRKMISGAIGFKCSKTGQRSAMQTRVMAINFLFLLAAW
jgi:hypothetical protein